MMYEVLVAGMVWDIFPTYAEAIEVALTLGVGVSVVKSTTAVW